MNIERAKKSIADHEGLRLMPYKDTEGFWTIGVGRKIHTKNGSFHEHVHLFENGITESKAMSDLDNDVRKAELGARATVGHDCWDELSDVRQEVLTEMVFQMGATGLSLFKHTLAYVRDHDSDNASVEMLDSKWAKSQSPGRARTLSARYASDSYHLVVD